MADISNASAPGAIPIVTCPQCGSHMRLCTIVPETERRERITFDCKCGFDYRQSGAVAAERTGGNKIA